MNTGYTLHEAIALARDIYKQVGSPPPFVRVDPILRYAEKVEAARSGSPHKVEVYTAKVTRTEFRGVWVRGRQVSKIFICKDLNLCWGRFVMCKEVTHLLVDDDDRLATTIQDQTEEAFELYWPKKAKVELTSEVFAAVVAFEVLYPSALRTRISNPPASLLDEAKKFMIPERYLDAYFKFPYGRLSEGINDGL